MRYLPNKLYLNFLPVTTIAQFVGKSCNNLYHFHVYTAVVCSVQLKLSLKPSSAQFAMLMFPRSSYLTLTSMLSFCILWLLTETLVTLMPLPFRNEYFNCFLVAFCCFFVAFPCIFFTKYFIEITISRSNRLRGTDRHFHPMFFVRFVMLESSTNRYCSKYGDQLHPRWGIWSQFDPKYPVKGVWFTSLAT